MRKETLVFLRLFQKSIFSRYHFDISPHRKPLPDSHRGRLYRALPTRSDVATNHASAGNSSFETGIYLSFQQLDVSISLAV